MAFVDAKVTKEIRNVLKEKFPKPWKFSVTKRHYSEVVVRIMEGPEDLGRICVNGYAQINRFHLDQYGSLRPIFEKVLEAIFEGAERAGRPYYDNSDPMTDYFDTAFYLSIHVGGWGKPYRQVRKVVA